jgi:hypothetical protein
MAVDGKPVSEKFVGAMGKNFMAEIVVTTIRNVLNSQIKTVKPGQLLSAIRDNVSIWALAGTDINQIAGKIPKPLIAAGLPMYRKAVQEYGSATELVLAWLKEDNPVLFSLIINSEGGVQWFDRQVKEMTRNLGLE